MQRGQLNEQTSGQTEVRSSVSQGSVLGSLLFTIFIDDIDEEVVCEISKFANGTKIAGQVNTLNDMTLMQKGSRKISSLGKLVGYGVQCKQVWSNAYREKKFRVSVPDE